MAAVRQNTLAIKDGMETGAFVPTTPSGFKDERFLIIIVFIQTLFCLNFSASSGIHLQASRNTNCTDAVFRGTWHGHSGGTNQKFNSAEG